MHHDTRSVHPGIAVHMRELFRAVMSDERAVLDMRPNAVLTSRQTHRESRNFRTGSPFISGNTAS